METPTPAADPRGHLRLTNGEHPEQGAGAHLYPGNIRDWKADACEARGGVRIGGSIDTRVLCATELK